MPNARITNRLNGCPETEDERTRDSARSPTPYAALAAFILRRTVVARATLLEPIIQPAVGSFSKLALEAPLAAQP
jgi:hypothetical protein